MVISRNSGAMPTQLRGDQPMAKRGEGERPDDSDAPRVEARGPVPNGRVLEPLVHPTPYGCVL